MKKYIGNIVVANTSYRVDEEFKKCVCLEETDDRLPTLVIGFENAKKIIENFNILVKKYENDMIWWTFSKTERRIDYEKDISDFCSFCVNKIIGNIKYYYINYSLLTYNKAKRCINYINNDDDKYYFIHNDKFIFIYDIKSRYIYGFSLSTCAFFGIDKHKIVSLVERNPRNNRIYNFFSIPNAIRRIVKDDIPSEIVLNEYF